MNPKDLEAVGIRFSVRGLDAGHFDISADEIPAYVTDPAGWYAAAYGASRVQIETFQQFIESGYRCNALTRRGTRCTNRIEEHGHLGVLDYNPKLDGFCRRHRADQGA